jgi:hypothetical protein
MIPVLGEIRDSRFKIQTPLVQCQGLNDFPILVDAEKSLNRAQKGVQE